MSLPRVSKRGFYLKGEKGQVLLLHGYTGTPYDLRPMADFLHRHNFTVIAPLLKGHGKNPHELNTVTAKDWLDQAENVLLDLDSNKPILLGGLSMGALIATILASTRPDSRALLLFSPAFSMGFLFDLLIALTNFKFLVRKPL